MPGDPACTVGTDGGGRGAGVSDMDGDGGGGGDGGNNMDGKVDAGGALQRGDTLPAYGRRHVLRSTAADHRRR